MEKNSEEIKQLDYWTADYYELGKGMTFYTIYQDGDILYLNEQKI